MAIFNGSDIKSRAEAWIHHPGIYTQLSIITVYFSNTSHQQFIMKICGSNLMDGVAESGRGTAPGKSHYTSVTTYTSVMLH
jgi:hypothetical protein